MRRFSVFLALLVGFIIWSCGGGGGGGGGEQPTPTPSQYTGKAILGNLAGATVKIFRVDNDGSLTLLWTEKTSNGNTLDEIGNFNSHANELDDNTLYIYQVSGGNDWDVDEDGVKDAAPTENKGAIRAIVLGKEVKEVGNNFVVSALTEFQYRWLARYLKYNFDRNKLLQERDRIASKFLTQDLNGDSTINQKDVISFVPQTDKDKIHPVIYAQGEKALEALHKDKPFVPRLATSIKKYNFGGNCKDVIIDGNYAYVVSPFKILDISDPKNPSVVSQLDTIYGYRLFKDGNYIYIADRDRGFHIVDVSDPNNPQEKGSIYLYDNDFYDVFVSEDYAYIAGNSSRNFIILDISDKTNPVSVKILDMGERILSVAVKGNYAYVGGKRNLYVIDITDKNNPSPVKTFSGETEDIAIKDNYLYRATAGIVIYDLSNPANPVQVGRRYTGILSESILINGNYAYVGDTKGVEVIDITDKTNPQLIGNFSYGKYVYGIAKKGDYLFLALHANYLEIASTLSGLQNISSKDFDEPSIVNFIENIGRAYGLFIDNDYLYVANGGGGLKIYDISNLPEISLVGSATDASFALKVFVSGDYAYIAASGNGLKIVDISDKSNPQVLSTLNVAVFDLYKAGDYVYLAGGSSKNMYIIDVSDSNNPSIEGTFTTTDYVYDVVVSGNYAYIANFTAGLKVVNISDPSNPSDAASLDTNSAYGVSIYGNYLYLSDGGYGLKIIDVTNPESPSLVGSVDTPFFARHTLVYGDYAFVSDDSSGVQIVNISDKSHPDIEEFIKTKHYAYETVIKNSYLFISDRAGGILIVDLRIFDEL